MGTPARLFSFRTSDGIAGDGGARFFLMLNVEC